MEYYVQYAKKKKKNPELRSFRILKIRILHIKKLPFSNEENIQTFSVKLKIERVYQTSRSLREILKDVC